MSSKILYFYKGIAFPIWYGFKSSVHEEFLTRARGILLGLKHGVDRATQIAKYTKQLDAIELGLCEICDPPSAESMNQMSLRFDKSEDILYITWVMNILALIIMGGLKDDNENGASTLIC
jgi:hypothetical protein